VRFWVIDPVHNELTLGNNTTNLSFEVFHSNGR
jgi:hypothetical protein